MKAFEPKKIISLVIAISVIASAVCTNVFAAGKKLKAASAENKTVYAYADGADEIGSGDAVAVKPPEEEEEKEYTITYVLNGGVNSAQNPVSYVYKTGVASFAEATKEGYVFEGWYCDGDFNSKKSSVSSDEQGDITLYAKWSEKASVQEVIFPDNVSVTYGARLSDTALSGSGSGYFEWTEPELIPDINEKSAAVRFVPEDYSLYPDDFEYVRSISINVEPALPVLKTAPVVTSLYTNIMLKTSRISGAELVGAFGEALEGTFEWVDGTKTYPQTGAYDEKIIFTPESECYKPLEIDVRVNVVSSSSSYYDVEYTINVSCSKNGYVSPSGNITVDEYSDLKIRFKPDDGYEISNVEIDGRYLDEDDIKSSYTFEYITSDHTIYVSFKKESTSKKSSYRSGKSSNVSRESVDLDDEDDDDEVKTVETVRDDKADEALSDRVSDVFDTNGTQAYISGYPDGSFHPNASLSRAEAAVILSGILKDKSVSTGSTAFSDVNERDWFYPYVSALTQKGIINGYSDGSYRPDRPITRAELISLAAAALDVDGLYSSDYTDIKGHWAENAIGALSAEGWINGYPDGSFRPDSSITRAEAVTFLNSVIGRKGSSMGKVFSDVKASDWFYSAVTAASGS